MRDLRRLAGLSLVAAARRMNITADRLRRAEEGEVDEELLATAAHCFGLDEDTLRDGYIESSGSSMFLLQTAGLRFDPRDIGTLERAMQAARLASTETGFRLHFGPVPLPRFATAVDAALQGHALARRVRAALDLGSEPIGDLRELLEERLGVVVLVDNFCSHALRAISVLDVSRTAAAAILADAGERLQNPPLTRVYLAHELCHLLFDPSGRGRIQIVVDDFEDERRRANVSLLESRANGFQAEFLIPLAGIKALLGERARRESSLRVAHEMVATVREHFGTPWEITTRHLRNHRWIDPACVGELLLSPRPPIDLGAMATSLPAPGAQARGLPNADDATVDSLVRDARRSAQESILTGLESSFVQTLAAIESGKWEQAMEALAEQAALADEADVVSELLSLLLDEGLPELPAFLVQALEDRDITPAVQELLIVAAEHSQVSEPALRARLCAALRGSALALRGTTRPEVLWSALRRYASMVPVEEADSLLDFLRPEDAPTTIQVALQGVFSVFTRPGVDFKTAARDRLRARVGALARSLIGPSAAIRPDDAALALCAYEAAAALDDPELPDLRASLEDLGRRYLSDRAHRVIDEIRERRGEPA